MQHITLWKTMSKLLGLYGRFCIFTNNSIAAVCLKTNTDLEKSLNFYVGSILIVEHVIGRKWNLEQGINVHQHLIVPIMISNTCLSNSTDDAHYLKKFSIMSVCASNSVPHMQIYLLLMMHYFVGVPFYLALQCTWVYQFIPQRSIQLSVTKFVVFNPSSKHLV